MEHTNHLSTGVPSENPSLSPAPSVALIGLLDDPKSNNKDVGELLLLPMVSEAPLSAPLLGVDLIELLDEPESDEQRDAPSLATSSSLGEVQLHHADIQIELLDNPKHDRSNAVDKSALQRLQSIFSAPQSKMMEASTLAPLGDSDTKGQSELNSVAGGMQQMTHLTGIPATVFHQKHSETDESLSWEKIGTASVDPVQWEAKRLDTTGNHNEALENHEEVPESLFSH